MRGPSIFPTCLFLVFGWTFIFFATGCGSGGGDEPDPGAPLTATLSSIQANIFSPRCAVVCHRSGGEGSTLTQPSPLEMLTSQDSFSSMVDVDSVQNKCGLSTDQPCGLRVKPFNPDQSYLIKKLEGTDISFASDRMPRNAPPLDPAEIAVIRQWIQDGALNN